MSPEDRARIIALGLRDEWHDPTEVQEGKSGHYFTDFSDDYIVARLWACPDAACAPSTICESLGTYTHVEVSLYKLMKYAILSDAPASFGFLKEYEAGTHFEMVPLDRMLAAIAEGFFGVVL